MDLYRFYDSDERLLYLGISLHAAKRASEHRNGQTWWPRVARMDIEHLECTRTEALTIEREAIKAERPLHNVVHNGAPGIPLAPLLNWECDECGIHINDGDGYLEIPSSEKHRWQREHWLWREKYPNGVYVGATDAMADRIVSWPAMFDKPEPMEWRAVHRGCDAEADTTYYHFDVERCRTAYDLLEWTAHLSEKEWVIESTDWFEFIRRVARQHKTARAA